MLCPIGQSNEKPPLQALAKWGEYVTENSVEASLHDNNGRGRKAEITDDDITWVISKACQKPKDYGYSAEF